MDWTGSVSGIPSSVWNVLLRGTFSHIDGDFCGIKVGHVCNLQFSEEEKCACSNPSESEVSTNMCESSTTSYLLRWHEIVFFGAREDLAQIVLHFENLWLLKIHLPRTVTKIMTQNPGKNLRKPFPFITNIRIPSRCFFRNAHLAHAQMLILWTRIFFAVFNIY